MNSYTRLFPGVIPIAALSLFLIVSAAGLRGDQPTLNAGALSKAATRLMEESARWGSVQTLKYEVDTRDTESDGFRQSINETGHDRDVLLTHLSLSFKGGDYGWKSDTLVQATGLHERVSTGGETNGILSVLFQGSRSVLMVTKNPKLQSSIPINGCNPLMEAFSFLASDDWQGLNCPEVSLSSLVRRDVWENAAKRVTSFSDVNVGSEHCIKIVFGPLAGNHDVIYFPDQLGGFPVEWQHYEGNYLRRDVSLRDAMVLSQLPDGASIALPHILRRRDYYDSANPEVYCTSDQTMRVVALNQAVDDDDLMIDPSLADSIYDRDADKRIQVPK